MGILISEIIISIFLLFLKISKPILPSSASIIFLKYFESVLTISSLSFLLSSTNNIVISSNCEFKKNLYYFLIIFYILSIIIKKGLIVVNLKVLILEDNLELLNKLTKILKREVKEVYSFSDSLIAYKEIPEIMPDVIVSDIQMKDMTGLQMYKKLREDGIKIPIIIASSFNESKYFIEAVKLRVKHFLVKPINTDELINELKKIEYKSRLKAQLKKNEELLIVQSRMAEMGEMIQNIAHQWKQPLNTISLCSTAMELDKKYDQDFINDINGSIRYMNDTINDFHNYFEPNKIKKCFYFKDTLLKVEKLVSSQINNINIIITENDNINLCSYENELIQALINLYKNSIDELSKIEGEKYIFIDIEKKEGNISFSIKDNAGGIKIDSKNINIIFNQYFSTKGTTGTGIGLYMSKLIVENNLDGIITVENVEYEYNSSKYEGACFNIQIKNSEEQ
ncbi:response regulator [Poseidonibacter ostreae]|nr:response regulator [Poseidonibacter ostreae]